MLTQLNTVKARLGLPAFNVEHDELLSGWVAAVTARFERECNRQFGRTERADEFIGDALELRVSAYPLESVTRFELKHNELEGWVEQTDVEYLVRGECVISLRSPLGGWQDQGRVTYVGGFVTPGEAVGPGQRAMPADLEQAAVEQIADWFHRRDKVGLVRSWPYHGTYEQFSSEDLLPAVQAVLRGYLRWVG